MSQTEKLLYTARTRTTGGRLDGMSRSSDGRLDIRLSPPGGAGVGTNPEQLFAAGWSACFEGAMEIAARKRKIVLPRLGVSLPGLDRDVARDLIDEAHQTCPYSKAVRGNIDVKVDLI